MKLASVYLIGVGPGDPDLISVRALRYLKTADVVVYDSLVDRRLLRSIHPTAEQIDVSPTVSGTLKQDATNALLVEKAREGKTVARLKLGDPFFFGRPRRGGSVGRIMGLDQCAPIPPKLQRACNR